MILPPPFAVLVLESEQGSVRFHEALAALEHQRRPSWAGWLIDALRGTRTDIPDDDTAAWARAFWFRIEGVQGGLPREPCPGIRLYRPGDDAPITTDPRTVHDAQMIMGPVLRRFLGSLEGDPTPEPEEVEASEAEIEPEGEGPEPDPTPEPDEPVTPMTTTGALPLLDTLTIETVAAPGGGWRTTIARGDEGVVTDISPTEPWNDPRAAGRLTTAICSRLPLNREAVRDALAAAFARQRDNPDGQALTSETVTRVLRVTRRVMVETTEPPVYHVDLDAGTLTFTAREVAAVQPITLNERWLGVYPRNPLRVTRRDFSAILEQWLERAEEVEPRGSRSVWEGVAEDLATRIAPLPGGDDRDDLARFGAYHERGGPLWVSGRLVQSVVRGAGQDPNDPGFARYLEDQGILVARSRRIRSGGVQIRAWGLDPAFKPVSDAEIVVSIPHVEGGRS